MYVYVHVYIREHKSIGIAKVVQTFRAPHHDIGQGGVAWLIQSEVSRHDCRYSEFQVLQSTVYLSGDV